MRSSKIQRRIGRIHCDMLAKEKPNEKASEEFHQKAYATRKHRKKEESTDGKEKR